LVPPWWEAATIAGKLRYEYGGTADAFVEIAGEVWLLDYKVGSGVYPDTALQLAGLARA
jgi:hypothetical protein